MKFSETLQVTDWEAATRDPVALIRCIPGVQSVESLDANSYRLQAVSGIGPVRLKLQGIARISAPEPRTLVADVTLQEPIAGTIYGTFRLKAAEGGIALEADVTLGGRLGEFAQPLLRKKADETVKGFQKNVEALVASLPR